jgi:ABC-type Na+ efflux pump permease subunit
MKLANSKTIYLKETKDILRDRRTLISMVVIPVLMFPLLFIGIGGVAAKLIREMQSEQVKVMILDPQNDPELSQRIGQKERFLSPLMILVVFPAVASMLPGMEMNCQLALVPILSTSLITKEILSNVFHWNYIFLILGTSLIYAAVALAVSLEMSRRESVLFRT